MQPALVKTTTTVVAATALNENCSARRKKANVRVKKKMEQIYMGNRKKVQLEKKNRQRGASVAIWETTKKIIIIIAYCMHNPRQRTLEIERERMIERKKKYRAENISGKNLFQ